MQPYEPKFTDFDLSPYTGLTRKSWVDAAKYLMRGVFDNISDIEKPVVMPRVETEVTYPHLKDEPGAIKAQQKAEIFEGLTRSFFIASVLIDDEPDIVISGIGLRDYYKKHILRSCCEKEHEEYVGSYEDMQALTGNADPFRPFQQTVETCALVIGLYMCREKLWDTYTKDEQDAIAKFLAGFAKANTVPQNWRLFNMLDMAFLDMYGYEIDEDIMLDHALACLNYYVGDGWYRDGHSFDYYSCWAFNFYAPLWNLWYGYKKMPGIAQKFAEHSNKLMESYPDMFDRDGFTNMWGRSCIYRNAATSAFDGNLFLKETKADPGLARRISSGSLLQFLKRDDFLANGIPSLGFYGQFSPLVQGYSCAESPFWLGKAFLCLHLKEDHPFWNARENNGTWERMGKNEVKETVLDGPGLVFTNHEASGQTVLRSAKVLKNKGDDHGMWNYSKLCYNTKLPWESSPNGLHNVESMQYVLRSLTDDHTEKANVTFYCKSMDGVLYRRQFFDYTLDTECHWLQAADLADFPVASGIMRFDRLRICKRPMEITLGSFGFPDNGQTDIRFLQGDRIAAYDEANKENRIEIIPRAVVLSGKDHTGNDKTLAFTIYTGFDSLDIIKSAGTNPDSKNSVVPYAKGTLIGQYDSSEDYAFISQTISCDRINAFSEDEIFPIKEICLYNLFVPEGKKPLIGAAEYADVVLKNGTAKHIDFAGIESRMTL